MKTITHNVKTPFMCRRGQFERDKQSLCVGLDMKVLLDNELIKVHIGKNKNTSYEITSEKAMKIGQQFTSKTGKFGVVVPIVAFKEIKLGEECDHLEKEFTATGLDTGYLQCVKCGEVL